MTIKKTRALLADRAYRCDPGCRGWDVYDEDTKPSVHLCQPCQARNPSLARMTDEDVAALPEAREELAAARRRLRDGQAKPKPGAACAGGCKAGVVLDNRRVTACEVCQRFDSGADAEELVAALLELVDSVPAPTVADALHALERATDGLRRRGRFKGLHEASKASGVPTSTLQYRIERYNCTPDEAAAMGKAGERRRPAAGVVARRADRSEA